MGSNCPRFDPIWSLAVGLELKEGGWVSVESLLDAFHKSGKTLSSEILQQVVAHNDKQRFEFSDDGLQIRAQQGHSVDVELGYEPAIPPGVLYHGTATHNLDSIFTQGLLAVITCIYPRTRKRCFKSRCGTASPCCLSSSPSKCTPQATSSLSPATMFG